jgi:uncharacterized lipoprotein YmbA
MMESQKVPTLASCLRTINRLAKEPAPFERFLRKRQTMTRTQSRLLRLSLGCLLAFVVAGCGRISQPVVYYNLTPLTAERHEPAATGTNGPLAIGVGPVTLPDSLDRPQIASRLDAERLKFDDYNRWSGSLSDDFSEVLLDDLAALLPAKATAALFPWGGYFQPTHRVIVNVSRFDGSLHGEVVLKARWTITDGSGKEGITTRQSVITVKVAGSRYQDLVIAQSQAVADLAKEIAPVLGNR